MNETRELFEKIKWETFKNVEIITTDTKDDAIIAILKIRGEKYQLLHYDYYMLEALQLTDHLDSKYIEFFVGWDDAFDFVYKFRTAIREDYNHHWGVFMEVFEDYDYFNFDVLRKYVEIFDEYSEYLCSGDCGKHNWNVRKYVHELEMCLERLNNGLDEFLPLDVVSYYQSTTDREIHAQVTKLGKKRIKIKLLDGSQKEMWVNTKSCCL